MNSTLTPPNLSQTQIDGFFAKSPSLNCLTAEIYRGLPRQDAMAFLLKTYAAGVEKSDTQLGRAVQEFVLWQLENELFFDREAWPQVAYAVQNVIDLLKNTGIDETAAEAASELAASEAEEADLASDTVEERASTAKSMVDELKALSEMEAACAASHSAEAAAWSVSIFEDIESAATATNKAALSARSNANALKLAEESVKLRKASPSTLEAASVWADKRDELLEKYETQVIFKVSQRKAAKLIELLNSK